MCAIIINLNEDKVEIINKEFQKFVSHLNINGLEQILKNQNNKHLNEIKINSIGEDIMELTKENKNSNSKISDNIYLIKSTEDKKPSSNKNEIKLIRDNNKSLNESYNNLNMQKITDFKYNLRIKFNSNSKFNNFEQEKPNIYSIKKFISNNLIFFIIVFEINEFNFDLCEELIDSHIFIRNIIKKNKNFLNNF